MTSEGVMYFQMDKNPVKELITPEDFKAYAMATYKSAVEYCRIVEFCFIPMFPDCIQSLSSISALASELFIKSIVSFEANKKCKGHDLSSLFELLSDNAKTIIKQYPYTNNKMDNFELELKEISKAFEVLRYGHERARMAANIVFIIEFMKATESYCSEVFESCKNPVDYYDYKKP